MFLRFATRFLLRMATYMASFDGGTVLGRLKAALGSLVGARQTHVEVVAAAGVDGAPAAAARVRVVALEATP